MAAEEAAQVKPEPKSEPASWQQSGEFSVPAPRQPKAAVNTGKGRNLPLNVFKCMREDQKGTASFCTDERSRLSTPH